jgi:Uri superfamily endonuclease
MHTDGKGIYVLILYLPHRRTIRIGRLGEFNFSGGYYAYVGSAFGPGGLAARLGHHLRRCRNPRWHIDYLRRQAGISEIWVTGQHRELEHTWAAMLPQMSASRMPVAGFGSSDCRCSSHLVYFSSSPSIHAFNRLPGIKNNKNGKARIYRPPQTKQICSLNSSCGI